MREEQKQKQENRTKQNPDHKTNGTAAVNRAVSQAWGLGPPGGVPGRCAIPSNKRALDSGGFRASDNCLEPFLTSPFFSHLSLRLSLPLTSHLSAFGSNVFGVLCYPKISV